MARPKKIGLEYFPLDCQMDDKIEMLEAEHDLVGFAVYIKLLQAIYQTDAGELDMSVIFRWKTLGKTLGIPPENLRKMVDTMLEVGLFCKNCFADRNVLTSNGIKKRLSKVSDMRQKDRGRKNNEEKEFSTGKPSENATKGKGKDTNVSKKETSEEDEEATTPPSPSEKKTEEKKPAKPLSAKEASHTGGAGAAPKLQAAEEHLFRDSPIFDKAVFYQKWEESGYEEQGLDPDYYHKQMLNWSAHGSKKKQGPQYSHNWLLTMHSFVKSDQKQNSLVYRKQVEEVHNSQTSKRLAQANRVMSRIKYDDYGNRI